MWEVADALSKEAQQAIVSHLRSNCRFSFNGDHRLTGERVSFYDDALLCELFLDVGASYSSHGKTKELGAPALFYFLFRPGDDEILIPLTGGEGDIMLAKRWLGLVLENDVQRLDYARFYYAFALTEKPPQFRNVPRRVSELRFKRPVTEKQIWGVYGAMWRFLVDATTLDVRVTFEPRGLHWLKRYRAHLPMQFGTDIFDVDLKIWERDGHVSYRKASLVYRDDALAAEPGLRPRKIGRPQYVRRSEWLRVLYGNFKTTVNQAAYLAALLIFLVASACGVLFPFETEAHPFVRTSLQWMADMVGIGNWASWLRAACFYCIAYFVFTTLLILDVETFRNSLLTWLPRFKGSRLDELVYGIIVRRRRVENGYRRSLFGRIRAAVSWLIVWTVYLVCVFTSLQVSLRPQLADDAKSVGDVMQLFLEQALLYVPVVFYYVGRKSLDPAKITLVTFWVLVAFQLIMGLLVIRRIHRFWASSAEQSVPVSARRD